MRDVTGGFMVQEGKKISDKKNSEFFCRNFSAIVFSGYCFPARLFACLIIHSSFLGRASAP
jgi:hypothetical protein